MSSAIVDMRKHFAGDEQMLSRLDAELSVLRRMKFKTVKIKHGSAQDAVYAAQRNLCRQHLYTMLQDNKIRAVCVGEFFGPFEKSGQNIAHLDASLRGDPDWARHNDEIVIVAL